MSSADAASRKPLHLSPKLILAAIGVVFIIILIMSSFFVVDQTEQAVVLRFGKYNRTVGPGLQTKLPLGIDKNYNVPTQVVQTMSFGQSTNTSQYSIFSTASMAENESTMLTGDLNIVDVQWIIQYRIENPSYWLFNVQEKERTIRDISQSVINQLVGDLPILAIMSSERSSIEVKSQEMMQKTFDSYELGIRIVTVRLQNIVPPIGEVQDAFEDVNKSIQDMNRFINEGKQSYNQEIPKAQGEASRLIQIAEGYAAERVNNAQGDVARFNSVREAYEMSKEITSQRLYIETMETILSQAGDTGSLLLIDKVLENFLPLANIGTPTGGVK
ncbi:MAG: FtsH protease activity modulator HflK [Sphaerochaetaceae bacterium]|jgi:membrane protease subunit HflK|nr:FtsH protease activity modulator HflK [Sphaerochaetaceae bacterium]NLO61771.1 FtsH protease activity modulator HflK [Spirochaetales bacterium]MDD4259385.1 FtsH protease activity modulator HflK [Sphaerochaetaceae bacterium]MDD4763843.1 FtsH protease activity modulator HflK [Sphaerochaetaceae bacterium]MDD4842129.1 FtsH protease activity modulator HflK [Sphaerochaetaceae bacterium]